MRCTEMWHGYRGQAWKLGWAVVAIGLAGCGSSPLRSINTDRQGRADSAGHPSVGSTANTTANWNDFKRQAAQRLVAANPEMSYMGEVPETLLAIPVLEIALNADGSVANIKVRRTPTAAVDTVDLAIKAVRRAAPFGSVRHLPKPWIYTEVFLFNDERQFKPRTLDD